MVGNGESCFFFFDFVALRFEGMNVTFRRLEDLISKVHAFEYTGAKRFTLNINIFKTV